MQSTDNTCLLLTTAPDEATANRIAEQLVSQQLAACVNIYPPMRSVYHWQGKVESEPELQLFIKTRRNKLAAIESWLAEHHPYDVPECLVFNADAGSPAYLNWMKELLDQ